MNKFGKPSEVLINPNQYTTADDLKWIKQEIVLYSSEYHISQYHGQSWCSTFTILPAGAEYKLCSQSKDGGDWMCGTTGHYSEDERRGDVLWCHEYRFVAGTNMRIFAHEDGGRYLRTESAFVPEMKVHDMMHHSNVDRTTDAHSQLSPHGRDTNLVHEPVIYYGVLIGCFLCAILLLPVIAYFVCCRGFAQANQANVPSQADGSDNV